MRNIKLLGVGVVFFVPMQHQDTKSLTSPNERQTLHTPRLMLTKTTAIRIPANWFSCLVSQDASDAHPSFLLRFHICLDRFLSCLDMSETFSTSFQGLRFQVSAQSMIRPSSVRPSARPPSFVRQPRPSVCPSVGRLQVRRSFANLSSVRRPSARPFVLSPMRPHVRLSVG